MALGYAGLILIDQKQYLVTDGTVDHVRPEIASEGTYAASNLNTATNKVHMFDLDEMTSGVNIDCNIELLEQLFDLNVGWVTHRDEPRDFLWYSNQYNNIEYGDAFWNRISISAGAGSFIACSIDMTIIPGAIPDTTLTNPGGIAPGYTLPDRNLQLGDDYISQKYGFASENGAITPNKAATPISFASPPKQLPIAYWQSELIFEDNVGNSVIPPEILVQNWSLEVNNPITRRNLCQATWGTDAHPGPTLLQVGLATMALNVTFITVSTPDNGPDRKFNVPEGFWNVKIKINNSYDSSLNRIISLGRIDLSVDGNDQFSKPVQQITDNANISGVGAVQEMSYQTQGYFTMPHIPV